MDQPTNEAAQEADKELLPHFYLRYRGRDYKIFKRSAERTAKYYIKLKKKKETFRRCLDTNVKELAEEKAKELIELWLQGRIEELRDNRLRKAADDGPAPKAPTRIATIGEVIAAYRKACGVFMSARAVNDNANALRLIVRQGTDQEKLGPDEVDALSCEVLTGSAMARFERVRLERAGADEERRQSALVSINSYARQARSIFKLKYRRVYVRDEYLLLPDLTGFLEEELHQPARKFKEAAPEALVRETFKEAQKLKEADRAAYVAFLLAVCSLRRGEVQRCRWSWLELEATPHFVRIPAASAKSKVTRVVPLPAAVARELREYRVLSEARPENEGREFVLPCPVNGQGGPGSRSRAQNLIRRVNAWMRKVGWQTRHTLHELRAYYLRELRRQHGLEVSGEVGGHSDLRVTRTNYTGQLDVRALAVELPLPAEG